MKMNNKLTSKFNKLKKTSLATLDDDGNLSVQLSIPESNVKTSMPKFKKRSILGSFGGGLGNKNFKSRGSIYTSFDKRIKNKTSLILKSPSISGSDQAPQELVSA